MEICYALCSDFTTERFSLGTCALCLALTVSVFLVFELRLIICTPFPSPRVSHFSKIPGSFDESCIINRDQTLGTGRGQCCWALIASWACQLTEQGNAYPNFPVYKYLDIFLYIHLYLCDIIIKSSDFVDKLYTTRCFQVFTF